MYLLINPVYNGVLPSINFQNQYTKTLRCVFLSFNSSAVVWDVLVDAELVATAVAAAV